MFALIDFIPFIHLKAMLYSILQFHILLTIVLDEFILLKLGLYKEIRNLVYVMSKENFGGRCVFEQFSYMLVNTSRNCIIWKYFLISSDIACIFIW